MNRKSILFLTNAYPDFDSSSRGIFIRKMVTLLQRDGFEISVVTPKIFNRSKCVEDQDGVKVYRFPFFSGNKLLIEHDNIPYFRMFLYYTTGFFITIYAVIKHRCQLIHVHWAIPPGLIGVWTGTLLRKPLVVTIHGSDFRLAMDKSSFLKRIFLYVCRRAKHLNCVSGVMTKEMEKLGINPGRMSTFPMGIDENFLETGKSREASVHDRPYTIVSNRNLQPIYNVSLLIRAIPIVLKAEPGVRFVIAGDGPERKKLEREAKKLKVGEFVQFSGRIPHERMQNFLSQGDIYVSTSLFDGTSVSLLEALASGIFPVVTDIPSNREWISDSRNGFLVPTNEEGVLAEKIIEAIQNASLVEKSRRVNLHLVEERALWSVTMEKTRKIYERLLLQVA